jgi:hypothetical protein
MTIEGFLHPCAFATLREIVSILNGKGKHPHAKARKRRLGAIERLEEPRKSFCVARQIVAAAEIADHLADYIRLARVIPFFACHPEHSEGSQYFTAGKCRDSSSSHSSGLLRMTGWGGLCSDW